MTRFSGSGDKVLNRRRLFFFYSKLDKSDLLLNLKGAGENTCIIHVWADYEFFTKVGNSDEANVSVNVYVSTCCIAMYAVCLKIRPVFRVDCHGISAI